MLQGTFTRVSEFYDHHPITETRVLAALARSGLGRSGSLIADDIFEFDQDHYGGLAAVDILARRAGVGATSRVLDVCAGLGGPARFLASRRGSAVVALELHAGRAAGAARLNRLVHATGVTVVRGDATALPFDRGTFDACLSQEALLHVADKPVVLAECHRVLARAARRPPRWRGRPVGRTAIHGIRSASRLLRTAGGGRKARRWAFHRDSLKGWSSDGIASRDPGSRLRSSPG